MEKYMYCCQQVVLSFYLSFYCASAQAVDNVHVLVYPVIGNCTMKSKKNIPESKR